MGTRRMRQATQVCLFALALAAARTALQAEETRTTNSDHQAAEALISRANALSDSGDSEGALPLYVQASQIDPRASMAFRGAGRALIELDRPEEAIPYLKDALRIDPTASRPWENLGLAYSAIYDRAAGEHMVQPQNRRSRPCAS